jgi:hypothetical protein
MSSRNQPASLPEGKVLAQFSNYLEAVKTVEQLVENGFPPRLISIIGSDLKTVEVLKGKLGYGRVALSGAVTGSWIGLFFGLLFGATSSAEQVVITNLSAGIFIGAGVGMLLNVIRFSMTKNKRSFISGQSVVAKKYDLVVPMSSLSEAKKAMKVSSSKTSKKPAAKKPASKS